MKNNVDKQYLDLVKHVLKNGIKKTDRTGTGTLSVFDYTMRFNMNEGFPLLTSKKMFTKGIIHELIWFLKGDTNIKYLVDNDVHIWDGDAFRNFMDTSEGDPDLIWNKDQFINLIKTDKKFAKEWGELGPVYGAQWRRWNKVNFDNIIVDYSGDNTGYTLHEPIDQIANLINDLKTNPDSRRLMVSAWDVGEISNMVLPPCHYGFQCYTQEMNLFERKKWWCESLGKSIHYAEDFTEQELNTLNVPKRRLSLKWTQRSCDLLLGVPFNIASYSLLLHILAREVNMVPNELIFSGGDVHIYLNHIDGAKEQLTRETYELPKLELTNSSIDNIKYDDIKIVNYKSSGAIKMELSN